MAFDLKAYQESRVFSQEHYKPDKANEGWVAPQDWIKYAKENGPNGKQGLSGGATVLLAILCFSIIAAVTIMVFRRTRFVKK